MSKHESALRRAIHQWLWLLPAGALGLYTGRLFSELLRPGLIGAVAITLLAVLAATLLLRRRPLRQTMPSVILMLYAIYPEPDPKVAAWVGILALLTWILNTLPPPRSDVVSRRIEAALLIALAALFLILYMSTLAPDVLPADNGEFQLIAGELGVAHPTGFPLYTVLANLMTRLPFEESPAYKVNLFSAMTSMVTLLLVYLSVRRLSGSTLGGFIAAFALATATTFWAQATTANIRSLTALFAAIVIYLLLVLRDRLASQAEGSVNLEHGVRSDEAAFRGRHMALLVLVITALSLGITHHISLVFMGIVFVAVLILLFPPLIRSPRLWPVVILAGAVGLLPLLYLPLRGAAGAIGAPEDLTTLEGFLRHVLALGFRGDFFYFLEPSLFLERVKIMAGVMTFQFNPLLLLFSAAGLVLMALNDRLAAFLLGGAFFVHAAVSALYRAPQTVEYMLPAYLPAAICLGYAVGFLKREIERTSGADSWARHLFASFLVALACVAVMIQFLDRLPSFRLLSDSHAARDYAQPLLEGAPPGAIILSDWHWVTPLWYLQEVEGRRQDIDVAYVFPTGEPYADTWARRISEALDDGRPVIATHFDETAYARLPAPEPYRGAFLFRTSPREELPAGFEPLAVNLDGIVEIMGFRLESPRVEVGQEAIMTVAWRPLDETVDSVNLFAHLVDINGQLVAQDDVRVQARPEGITLTQFRLTPRPGAAAGDHEILIGGSGTGTPPDPSGPSRFPVAELSVAASSWPPPTDSRVYRPLVQDDELQRLVGYDWDHTIPDEGRLYLHWETAGGYRSEVRDLAGDSYELPAWYGPWGLIREGTILEAKDSSYYVPFGQGIVWIGRPLTAGASPSPGQDVEITQHFVSSRPLLRDLVVSVRLVGFEEDGFHWAWWDLDDGVPAMGAIPTLKWIQGSRVRDPHWLKVPEEARTAQVTGPLLRLYDAFTGRPLPILDERISSMTAWIPLGRTAIAE